VQLVFAAVSVCALAGDTLTSLLSHTGIQFAGHTKQLLRCYPGIKQAGIFSLPCPVQSLTNKIST